MDAQTFVNSGGKVAHFYPFHFSRILDSGERIHAGIERIDGIDYTFGDLDAIFEVPANALNAFRGYLESLPRRPEPEVPAASE